jgi:hypothetical protein
MFLGDMVSLHDRPGRHQRKALLGKGKLSETRQTLDGAAPRTGTRAGWPLGTEATAVEGGRL